MDCCSTTAPYSIEDPRHPPESFSIEADDFLGGEGSCGLRASQSCLAARKGDAAVGAGPEGEEAGVEGPLTLSCASRGSTPCPGTASCGQRSERSGGAWSRR
ncbi:unnamed protein product [Miscanthus lutarioriparius]|uniref:Uncharacterized protein n=1 Tax=Miscanthus lutarioriparius TaxID=422564 RepID=A0A811P3E9_9POAL|nr:unnamed protein product [Miscanthus lutarioriparius]